jgi:hypothetical protein
MVVFCHHDRIGSETESPWSKLGAPLLHRIRSSPFGDLGPSLNQDKRFGFREIVVRKINSFESSSLGAEIDFDICFASVTNGQALLDRRTVNTEEDSRGRENLSRQLSGNVRRAE